MNVKVIQRKFLIVNNTTKQTIELPEVNQQYSVEKVKDFYATQYPELLNCQINQKGLEKDKLVFEFLPTPGTKG